MEELVAGDLTGTYSGEVESLAEAIIWVEFLDITKKPKLPAGMITQDTEIQAERIKLPLKASKNGSSSTTQRCHYHRGTAEAARGAFRIDADHTRDAMFKMSEADLTVVMFEIINDEGLRLLRRGCTGRSCLTCLYAH